MVSRIIVEGNRYDNILAHCIDDRKKYSWLELSIFTLFFEARSRLVSFHLFPSRGSCLSSGSSKPYEYQPRRFRSVVSVITVELSRQEGAPDVAELQILPSLSLPLFPLRLSIRLSIFQLACPLPFFWTTGKSSSFLSTKDVPLGFSNIFRFFLREREREQRSSSFHCSQFLSINFVVAKQNPWLGGNFEE